MYGTSEYRVPRKRKRVVRIFEIIWPAARRKVDGRLTASYQRPVSSGSSDPLRPCVMNDPDNQMKPSSGRYAFTFTLA